MSESSASVPAGVKLPAPSSALTRFLLWVRNCFIAGLFIVVPIGITVWIILFIYNFIKGPLDRLIRFLIEHHRLPGSDYFIAHHDGTIPFAGFSMTLLLILLIGILTQNYIGRAIMRFFNRLITKVPIVKNIYQGIVDMVDSIQQFSSPEKNSQFRTVVLVPMAGNDSYWIGYLTGRFQNEQGAWLANVFVPTPPNPFNGLLFIVPEEKLIYLDGLSVEQATKMIISLGMITPKDPSLVHPHSTQPA